MADVQVSVDLWNSTHEYGSISGDQVIKSLYVDRNMTETERQEMLQTPDEFTAVVVDLKTYHKLHSDFGVVVRALKDLIETVELRSRVDTAEASKVAERLSNDWAV